MEKDKSICPDAAPQMATLQTTLGDLICAISDAASETAVEDKDIAAVTQVVLNDMLSSN
jgi:hypothetical protein